MQFQMLWMQTIGEVMKEAYRSGNGGGRVQQDPMDTFSGVLEAVESGYSKAMAIQSKIMERVFTRSMENRFGLTGESDTPAPAVSENETAGIVSQYAPLVREVVDGMKTVFSFFDKVPKDVVKKVKSDDRFRALVSDPKALIVVGQALRREFGDERAKNIMKSFGVNMVIKPEGEIVRTPEIPGITDRRPSKIEPKNGKAVPVAKSRVPVVTGKGERKGEAVSVK